MLTYESNSPIRVRSKKESAIWITLLVVMCVLLCIAIVIAGSGFSGLFGPVEGGAWWAYGETQPVEFFNAILGKGIVRFVTDSQWEVEVLKPSMFATMSSGGVGTNGGRLWATGPYEFVGEPGEGALRMKIDSTMACVETGAVLNPENARLCSSGGEVVPNGEWVEYLPDENGIYYVKVAMVSEQAEGRATGAEITMEFPFALPEDEDKEPGYYHDEELAFIEKNGIDVELQPWS